MEYDEKAARATERSYQSPEIVKQRQRTIEFLMPQTGEHIVDIGCGPGMLTLDLANAVGPGGSVTGIDASAAMIDLAERRCNGLSQVDLIECSATDVRLDDEVADAVTCTQVLLYVDDVPAALDEIHRLLRPGGRVLILETDWRSTVLHSNDESLTEKIVEAWDHAVPSPRLPARMGKLLRNTGFTDIEIDAFPIVSDSTSPNAFSMSMMQQCSQSACEQGRITAQQGKEWVAGLMALGAAGEFFFSVNRFIFQAIKL